MANPNPQANPFQPQTNPPFGAYTPTAPAPRNIFGYQGGLQPRESPLSPEVQRWLGNWIRAASNTTNLSREADGISDPKLFHATTLAVMLATTELERKVELLTLKATIASMETSIQLLLEAHNAPPKDAAPAPPAPQAAPPPPPAPSVLIPHKPSYASVTKAKKTKTPKGPPPTPKPPTAELPVKEGAPAAPTRKRLHLLRRVGLGADSQGYRWESDGDTEGLGGPWMRAFVTGRVDKPWRAGGNLEVKI